MSHTVAVRLVVGLDLHLGISILPSLAPGAPGTACLICAAVLRLLSGGVQAQGRHNGSTQERCRDTRHGLRHTVKLDGESFRLAESPTVTIRVTNVSEAPVRF
jgi:hypothetical protein